MSDQQPTRPSTLPLNKLTRLQDLLDHPQFSARIKQAIPKHMAPERLLRTFVTSVQKTPKLRQVDCMSMLGAFITLASLGLEPNTPLQHAYLIPFDEYKWNPQIRKREIVKTNVNLIIGYAGYIDLIYRGDKIKDVQCHCVWEGDAFDYEYGTNKRLHHKPKDRPHPEGEEPLFAYMHARLTNGGEQFEVLTRADVHAIRARSQGFKTAMNAFEYAKQDGKDPLKTPAYSEAPWIRWPVPMWRKTALRAGQKWLPKTIEVASAVALDEAGDEGRVDFSQVIEANAVEDGLWETAKDQTEQQANAGQTEAPDSVVLPAPQPVSSQIEHAQTVEPTATFGLRWPAHGEVAEPRESASIAPLPAARSAPVNASPPQPAAKAPLPKPPAPAPAPAPAPVPPSVPVASASQRAAFRADLIDETGECSPDGPWLDPDQWAAEFVGLIHGVPPEFLSILIENNQDGIEQLRKISGHNWQEIERIINKKPQAHPLYVEMPLVRGKPSNKDYVKACEERINTLKSSDDISEFMRQNEQTYQELPQSHSFAIKKALATRQDILGLTKQIMMIMPSTEKNPVTQSASNEDVSDFPGDLPESEDAGDKIKYDLSNPFQSEPSLSSIDPEVKKKDELLDMIKQFGTAQALVSYFNRPEVQAILTHWRVSGRKDLEETVMEVGSKRFTELGG